MLLVALLASAGGAAAQEEPVIVRLDGRALSQVGPGPDVGGAERARWIEGRLSTLLRNLEALAPAVVQPAGVGRVVAVSGVPVVSVSPEDARDNLTTIDALALASSRRPAPRPRPRSPGRSGPRRGSSHARSRRSW